MAGAACALVAAARAKAEAAKAAWEETARQLADARAEAARIAALEAAQARERDEAAEALEALLEQQAAEAAENEAALWPENVHYHTAETMQSAWLTVLEPLRKRLISLNLMCVAISLTLPHSP